MIAGQHELPVCLHDAVQQLVELAGGQRPKRLDHCAWAYDPRGVTASVNDRHQIVVGGRPLLKARGGVWHLAWGVDGARPSRSAATWSG